MAKDAGYADAVLSAWHSDPRLEANRQRQCSNIFCMDSCRVLGRLPTKSWCTRMRRPYCKYQVVLLHLLLLLLLLPVAPKMFIDRDSLKSIRRVLVNNSEWTSACYHGERHLEDRKSVDVCLA